MRDGAMERRAVRRGRPSDADKNRQGALGGPSLRSGRRTIVAKLTASSNCGTKDMTTVPVLSSKRRGDDLPSAMVPDG
jgi:hypothetical protein